MELDWTTFTLEIINFLVLVWLLKRFLYKPVMHVIAQRKAAVEKSLAEARDHQTQAEALKGQYQNRLADWEHEKEQARAGLREEIEAQRQTLTASLQAELERLREKHRAMEERRLDDLKRRHEETAMVHGRRFTARLLERLAGPELEARLVDLALEDLPRATRPRRQPPPPAAAGEVIKVTSAFPLDDSQRRRIAQALGQFTGHPVNCEFRQDADLVAGLRIGVGAWILRANLRDELQFFAEARHGGEG